MVEYKVNLPLEDENLLALDPATICGWATQGHCGTIDVSMKADESNGLKWLRFWAKLDELCARFPIHVIVYERPAGKHVGALIHHSKMIAVIEAFCEYRGIDYCAFSSSEVKKFATGKGNCSKDDMIQAAQEKLGYAGSDDNEADALWMLELLKVELRMP